MNRQAIRGEGRLPRPTREGGRVRALKWVLWALSGLTAMALLATFLHPFPAFAQSSEASLGQGMILYQKGDLRGALAAFTKAIELNPKNPIAYTNRGLVRYKLGDFDGALADHTRAIELNPHLAEAYTNRGGARLAKEDLEGAKAGPQTVETPGWVRWDEIKALEGRQ